MTINDSQVSFAWPFFLKCVADFKSSIYCHISLNLFTNVVVFAGLRRAPESDGGTRFLFIGLSVFQSVIFTDR